MRFLKLALIALTLASGLAGVSDAYQRTGFVGRSGPVAFERQAYDADAQAVFAAMDVQPSDARKALINSTILDLKGAGIWPVLDMLQVYAAHDQQAARVDWKNPSRVAAAVNNPGFTEDLGFLPNGSTSYVNTNYSPASGPNFGINSHVFGFRLNSDVLQANMIDLGNLDNAYGAFISSTPGGTSIRSSNTGSASAGTGASDGRFHAIRRTSAAGGTAYYAKNDGILHVVGDFVSTASTIDSTTMFAGARNSGSPSALSNRRISLAFAGGGMTSNRLTAFAAIMQKYMNAVGNTN